MDISTDSSVHNAITEKLSQEANIDEGRNRIGVLPDKILENILFFLPTKDVVKTSVLSKRWLYLWCSAPKLFLIHKVPGSRKVFMNFVERALVLRTSDIRKFSLSLQVFFDSLRVNSWVFSAVNHKVQEMHLYLDTITEQFVLPDCLFSAESLRILELCMIHYLKLPSFICFSSLKVLTLEFILFPDEKSTQKLFSGCPLLEDLKLCDCDWVNVGGVCISAPKLHSLFIRDHPIDKHNIDGCQIIFVAPCLKSLAYVGDIVDDYFFYNSSSLVDVCFGVQKRERLVAYRARKFLQGLSSVKKLTLSTEAVMVLASAVELLESLPVFRALTCLTFVLEPMDFTSGVLWSILQNSPYLTSLEFKMGVFLSKMDCESDDWTLDPMPPCFWTHLKTISICNFLGTEEELHVIKNLLKNAMILERMAISCAETLVGLKQQNVRQELLMLRKRSSCCEVIVS